MEKSVVNVKDMSWILKSMLAAYLTTIILLLALSFGLYKFDFTEQTVQGGIIATYVLSAFVGGRVAGKIIGVRRFVWGLIAGLLYFVLLLIISLLVYRSVQDITGIVTNIALCAAGGMFGGMVS